MPLRTAAIAAAAFICLFVLACSGQIEEHNQPQPEASFLGPNPASCADLVAEEEQSYRGAEESLQEFYAEREAEFRSGKLAPWKWENLQKSREASSERHNRRIEYIRSGIDIGGEEALYEGQSPAHCTYRWWRWDWGHTDPAEDGHRGRIMDQIDLDWTDFEDGKVINTLCRMANEEARISASGWSSIAVVVAGNEASLFLDYSC